MEIKNLIDRLDDWDGVDAIYNGEFVEAKHHGVFRLLEEAAAALEQLQAENDRLKEEVQQMRWIPVEERLPEKSGEYLIFTDEKEIYAMEFDEDMGDKGEFGWWTQQYSNGGWAGSDWATAEDITHWMPLPKLPKEEKK